ncbi:hypothetical protein GCM10010123_24560 [Pilimelia anulata]|uniref:Guanylate kinase n=1 Tax=Pilimelia anulata TaxID=53371 RepID=A0A8J3B6V4_9ACTN|nr:kinase [Pilimelia anulata]GGJ93801.1 hypothetical protein GCM10010123_24560 [Pilimelia anulata]
MSVGLILYGPPGAGKSTVTDVLHVIDPIFALFKRLKAGPGRTDGYRIITLAEMDRLRSAGLLVWENHRYGATYAIDREGLISALAVGIPVVHLGQTAGIDAVRHAMPGTTWSVVYLWCSREESASRITNRGGTDLSDRLSAWDQTVPLKNADLTLDTTETSPRQAAQLIQELVWTA